MLTRAHRPCDFFVVFVPRMHIQQIAQSEECEATQDFHRLLIPRDPVLQHAMFMLSSCAPSLNADAGCADEAARRLILRIVEINGGGRADWQDDTSVFNRRTLRHLVECIDAHLTSPPCLGDMAIRVGLSPSHFAKKFRQSMGLSFHRFVNRRRILASMVVLKSRSTPLARIALDLGFSSQAHFTHVFSSLTGMTPAKYRKQFMRVVGERGLPATSFRPARR